jgi:hypothetical protein
MQVWRISSPHFKGMPICSHDFRRPQSRVVQPFSGSHSPLGVHSEFCITLKQERTCARSTTPLVVACHDRYKRLIWHQGGGLGVIGGKEVEGIEDTVDPSSGSR